VHAVPADDTARTRIARVMGYRDTRDVSALEQFDEELRRHQSTVRSIHERVFFRPLLDTLVGSSARSALAPDVAEARLAAFGFTDVERTRQALRELTRGLTRWSRLMRQMLPLLLSWLADSPDPDLGMLGLRRLTTGKQRSTELATAFRESPEGARRLCMLLGTSALLGNALEHNPDLIPGLGEAEFLGTRSRDELVEAAQTALEWRDDVKDRQPGLLRLKTRELVRVGARDILELGGEEDVESTATELTSLAEATVEAALSTIAPGLPFAVIAMGRFGAAELSYASDLDLVFVYDGASADDFSQAEGAATELVRFLQGTTPAARIYDVDVNLRPEGKDGVLARSLEGFDAYYTRWAQTWERQALLKARPVAGNPELGARFLHVIEPYLWRGLTADEAREIRRMKARIERERIPSGEDPQFHLKLGRGSLSDIEFTAQLLQLQHGVKATGTMAALRALESAKVLGPDDADVLAEAYRFCERTRNRWFLIKGSPGDSLPTKPDQLSRLARSLDTTPAALREQYRRVTRRARQVVTRVFYGVADV
jgi:glutamate-ammonia-ligase adenylyltransferase